MTTPLEANFEFFQEQLPNLLAQGHEGRFAVGRVGDKIECYDSYEEAHHIGNLRYRLKEFLIKKVEREETHLFFSRDLKPYPTPA